jgi:DNA helicase IV
VADPVLTTEREQLRRSRDYLRLMREDVLSLKAMAGDRVSQEYLKAELYHRAEALKDIPDTPLFFGRLDYAGQPGSGQPGTGQPGTGQPGTRKSGTRKSESGLSGTGRSETGISDDGVAGHSFHIGRRHVHAPDGTPAVIDWRAPVSRPFYRASGADPMNLELRRRFGFSGGELTAYEDELFTTDRSIHSVSPGGRPPGTPRDEHQPSQILINEIERPRSGPMRDIVATIQPDQDDIVRADAAQTVCVQGAPGTGSRICSTRTGSRSGGAAWS